jgi:hypothetical protein
MATPISLLRSDFMHPPLPPWSGGFLRPALDDAPTSLDSFFVADYHRLALTEALPLSVGAERILMEPLACNLRKAR